MKLAEATRGEPLPDVPQPLADNRPWPGQWVLGRHWPLKLWWKCPLCRGQVPIEPYEVNEEGIVHDSLTHSLGNEVGAEQCSWSGPLRLLDYDHEEHERAVARANREVAGVDQSN